MVILVVTSVIGFLIGLNVLATRCDIGSAYRTGQWRIF